MAAFRTRKYRCGPLPFHYVLLLTVVFFTISTSIGLWIVNKGIKPTLISYAETQTRKVAPMVINKAVREIIPNVKNLDEVIIPDSAGGNAKSFDVEIINKLASDIATAIQRNIKTAERGNLQLLETEADVEIDIEKSMLGEGIVYSVPIGQATNNALLGNLGPRIPIKFTVIGDVQTNVITNVEQYPINNIFITVSIQIQVNMQIIIPFSTNTAVVEQEIPVAIGYYPGDVPQFYNWGSQTNPSIQFPITPSNP